jgi:transcriptional regulator with XRE-family HTH domain
MGPTTAGIGARLNAIRRKWQLSTREVEERSVRLAKDRSNPSYQISAAWLKRLEREEHKLTVSTLFALSQIYNVPTEHLLCSTYSANDKPSVVSPIPRHPEETTLLLPDEPENFKELTEARATVLGPLRQGGNVAAAVLTPGRKFMGIDLDRKRIEVTAGGSKM